MVTAPSVGIYPPQSQQGHLFLYFSVPMAGGLPRWLSNKEPACQYRRHSSMPGSGRSPGGGHDYPLQSSCPENPMDRGAWWATVHRVAKSQTWQGVHSDGRSEEDSTPSSRVTRADDSPGETQHSHHSWGSDQNRPEDSSLPSCSPLSPLSFLTDPLCQWLTASHGLLGKGVWLLSFKRDGSQNKLLFHAHTLLAIWTSSKL